MKNNDAVEQLFRRFNSLKGQRDIYNNMWDDITEFVLPHRGDFAEKRATAQQKTRRLFDSTAIRANEFLAATLKDGVMPIYDQWGRITTLNQDINLIDEVKEYFDSVNIIMYAALNNPNSNFHSQNHEMFLDLCAYGTACMYVDDNKGKNLRFKTIHLSEIYLSEDKNGNIDTVFRKFQYTPRQAVQQWGYEALSENLKKCLEEKPDEKFDFLHCVKPNEDYDGTGITVTNLPWASYYCEMADMHVLERSGYHEMPYKIPRWFKFVGETYGRSPAWGAMPDIMMINNLKQILIKASQKAADPVYLLADDGVILPLDTRPGGVNFGGIDPMNGRPRVQTLPNDGRFDVTYRLLEGVTKDIRDAFYSDQLADRNTDRMTATAVTELKDEKLRLIGPSVGRIQTEFAGPLLQRVYGMLSRAGAFPEPSPAVAEILDSVALDISFSAPLFNTERRQEPIALQRALQALAPFAQTDPNFWHNFDMRETTKQVSHVLGVPGKYMASDEEYEAKVQEDARRAQEAEQVAKEAAMAETQANVNKGAPRDE